MFEGSRPVVAEWTRRLGTDVITYNPRSQSMKSHSSPLIRHLAVSVYLALFMVVPVVAQPSGGPYGPIEQFYEVPTSGTVYFVAPDGDPAASGTDLNSPTTIESAIERVVTDDAIILRGGVYRTGDLVLNQGITLQPYGDEKPVLKGTHVATQWEPVQDGVWRTRWETLFPSEPLPWWQREREEARTPLHRFNNDLVFVDGEFTQSAGGIEEVNSGTHYIDYDAQYVYIGADPAEHVVEITAYETALLRTAAEVHGKVNDHQGPAIRGITFTQYAWTALAVEGERHFTHLDEPVDEPIGPADPSTYGKQVIGTLLENVTISFVGRVAGYFRGDGLVIRNSLISDTGTEGIYIIGSSDVLLERNIVQRNDIERITGYYVSAVKIINQTHNVVVRDNLVIDHPTSNGVWYDVGNRDGVFINNYVEGTTLGFFFEISRGVTVAGNVFKNNGLGAWFLNSADGYLYNNTFVDSPIRVSRDPRAARGDLFGWHPATGPDVDEREGHIIKNNLVVATEATHGPLVEMGQAPPLCETLHGSGIAEMDGNVYVRPVSPYPNHETPLVRWQDTSADRCSVSFTTLSEFQAGVGGYEQNGVQLEGDARSMFVSPDLRRFELIRDLSIAPNDRLPADVRALLGWSADEARVTVGALPAE